MAERVGGTLFVKANGEQLRAKGSWTYNIGQPKREAIVGADQVHGYKEMPQAPFIEGAMTDSAELDLSALLNTKDATCTLELANGKVIVLRDAWWAGDGNVTTEEGEIAARFEGISGEEVA
jgi:hypothetical protein